jgi:hypothetical protein
LDIFYYWKSFEDDLAKGRLGWLRSQRSKLETLQERGVDCIWAFKTPKGMKRQLQVIARMVWSGTAPKDAPRSDAGSMIFYEPHSERSVRFVDSASQPAMDAVSSVLRRRYPSMFKSNFQGDSGLQALEIDVVRELEICVKEYATVPFALR